MTDTVGPTTETWEAETGSFDYDANGNVKTAPAPYAITAVTYDHQNLPISLTSAGTTKTYRYNEAGQRITKRVGTGNTEVYLLDGATSLGVFTVDGAGAVVASFFNVLAGDKVIGRQPSTGNRRYYHTDLLGSTRAVVEGATVVESYDFEPWGLLMPGRTLAGPTKEGFTGKEQDAETGLDYFGARYYMPALARWTAVDALAEKHPEWNPYNYVLNNPLVLIDPDGKQISALIGDAVGVPHAVAVNSRNRVFVDIALGAMNAGMSTVTIAPYVKTGAIKTSLQPDGASGMRIEQELSSSPNIEGGIDVTWNLRDPPEGEQPFSIGIGIKPYIKVGVTNEGPTLSTAVGPPDIIPVDVSLGLSEPQSKNATLSRMSMVNSIPQKPDALPQRPRVEVEQPVIAPQPWYIREQTHAQPAPQ